MGRGRVGDDLMPVRFPDGTFERIDALGGNRSEFIRDAVSAALGDVVRDRAVVGEKNSNEGSDLSADALELFGVVSVSPISSRDLEKKFSWLGLRYSKAEAALLSSDLAEVSDGLLRPRGFRS